MPDSTTEPAPCPETRDLDATRDLEDVWRAQTPYVLAALLRRSGDLPSCEDAVQEALLAAARQWPEEGRPDNPRGWLIRVASRRLLDAERSETARARREEAAAVAVPADAHHAPPADAVTPAYDDSLRLMLMCAHPSLSAASRVALTLRAVGGLTTAQVAAGFLVPEATMAQRISRAKATLARDGVRFEQIRPEELAERLAAVRHVLYLVFNEGYAASSGAVLVDADLTREALRLTRMLHRSVPDDTETAGLLALLLLTHARTPARTTPSGDLVPLAEQDRTRWDHEAIRAGIELITRTLHRGRVGPFQVQAAIAAVHAEAPTWEGTDWLQICLLYRTLGRLTPSPTVTLNLAIAVGTAHGAFAGLAELRPMLDDPSHARNHRVHAARAHLLELAGETETAAAAYRLAASLATSIPEQRYLNARLARLGTA